MAKRGYIDRVDIVLLNAAGKEIRAAKYSVSTDAGLWTTIARATTCGLAKSAAVSGSSCHIHRRGRR